MHRPKTFAAILLTVLFLVVNISCVIAQSNPYFLPTIFNKPPNTTAQERYGEYPVNMFSGVPEISIPLYEIKSGELSLPITLSYHASGNKVMDFAGWAGLGWSLSTGGEVSRRVMGLPDDSGTGGYLNGTILLAAGNNINDNFDEGRIFMTQAKDRLFDMEPDIFSYNYPGGSGKFFFNGRDNNKPALIPYAPVKIEKTGLLSSFTITNEHGTRHLFGTSVVSTGTFSYGLVSANGTASWPLEKVISQSGRDTISLNYSSVSYGTPAEATETLVVDDNITQLSGITTCMNYHNNPGSASSGSNGGWVTEQQPASIFFKNGKVVFVKSAADRLDFGSNLNGVKSLQAIEVYRLNQTTRDYVLLKSYKFYQSYYYNGSDVTTRRLRLDSLAVVDGSGIIMQKYKFAYNTTTPPSVNSKGKDYWGYYNGKDNQSSLIPQTTIDFVTGAGGSPGNPLTVGSDAPNGREPDSTYMQAGILQRIYYPTGGFTDFSYQTNRYQEDNVTKLAGGLRVASIKSYTGSGATPVVKTYQYSQARKNFNLGNYTFMTEQTVRHYPGGSCGIQATERMRRRTFVSVPTTDIEPWDGVPVAYGTVTEYNGDPSTNIGKTVYTFRDHPDAGTSASYYGKPVYQSYFYARGQLQSKSTYKALGANNYQIVQRESMGYSAFPETHYDGIGFLVGRQEINQDAGYDVTFAASSVLGPDDSGRLKPAFYSFGSDDNYLTYKQTAVYDQNDTTRFTTQSVQYKYNNIAHQQVSQVISQDSKGNTIVSTKRYAPDFLSAGATTTSNTVLDNMIARNMLTSSIESIDTLKRATAPLNTVTGALLNTYKTGSLGAIVPDRVFKLKVAAPLTDFVPAAVSGGSLTKDSRYQAMVSFDSYDGVNNILQYTARNAGPANVIWDYANDLPVAEIKNAVTADVAFSSFETLSGGNWSLPGNFRRTGGFNGNRAYDLGSGAITKSGLSASKVYLVSYWVLGSTSCTVSGTLTGYPLKSISVNGWTQYVHRISGVSAISVSGTGRMDDLRLLPENAAMTTRTYDPLIGLTSTTDEKGQSNYFEYDGVQRLVNIRDRFDNIVKSADYNLKAISAPGFIDQALSDNDDMQAFVTKSCPAGYTGTGAWYTIAAGTYQAASKSGANALAQADINANKQIFANDAASGCSCILNINVTLSNTTGAGFTASFRSGSQTYNYNFADTNTVTVQVPQGNYTVDIVPTGAYITRNIQMGNRPVVIAPRATFNNVNISAGSSDLNISVTP